MRLAVTLRRRSPTSQPFLCGLGFCSRGSLSATIGLPHGLIFSPQPFGNGKDHHSNCQRSFSTSRLRVVDGRSLPGFRNNARPLLGFFSECAFLPKNIDIPMGCNCGRKTRIVARLTSAAARKERTDEIVGGGLSPAERKRKIEILKRKKIL